MVALLLAAGLLDLVLIAPNDPAATTWSALRLIPLELPVILAVLVALPARAGATLAIRGALVAVLVALTLLKAADMGTFLAYGRPFTPVADLHLVAAGWHLAVTTLGPWQATGLAAGGLAAVAALAAALWAATGLWARCDLPGLRGRAQLAPVLVALAAGAVAVAEIGQRRGAWTLPVPPPGAAFTANLAVDRVLTAQRTLASLQAFEAAAAQDPFAGATGLFDRIGDRDVLLTFVESYGRASFDVPFYAERHRATLRAAETRLTEAGLAMRSGWLTAPMVGGQSWLAHASVGFGLWIPDQTRYRALLASPRRSLFHLAHASGFHTAAVMPAITYDWPEARRMGFDTILTATELGYEGTAFNWVTMPDQFTLSALERGLRQATPRGAPPPEVPLFAQVALISSHAPWVPVPDLVSWDAVGDGRVFDAMAERGDPPETVWRDMDRVRAQYRKAVDYALRTVTAYAERTAESAPLMIVLGDHQTGTRISMSDSFDVPVHVIGPPDLVARVAAWGWTEGLLPGPDVTPWTMDRFRDSFVAAFSSTGPTAALR